jgi:16S rRNA (guanine966-N2)-methyltransferase
MTRIISGDQGGRRLKVPSSTTRPTSSRVREALFAIVESQIAGRRSWDTMSVLDLYAGSGALAFEALSRGALLAWLVERDAAALRTIRANALDLGLTDRVRVVNQSVERFVAQSERFISRDGPQATSADRCSFGLVFLDPPYDLPNTRLEVVLAAVGERLMAPDGVAIVERSARTSPPRWPPSWEDEGMKRYGETAIYLARTAAAGGSDSTAKRNRQR